MDLAIQIFCQKGEGRQLGMGQPLPPWGSQEGGSRQ